MKRFLCLIVCCLGVPVVSLSQIPETFDIATFQPPKSWAYNSVVMDGLRNAWNALVAPRYRTARNFESKPIMGLAGY